MKAFATKVNRQSVPVISEWDMDKIKSYQKELVNYFLYETKRGDEGKRAKLMDEIRSCEVWLKDKYTDFLHDKNRKIAS